MSHAPISYEGRDLEAMSFAQNYHRWISDIFRPFLGKRIAEVGAGSGNFSPLLLSDGVEQLVSVEPSADMYPLLVEKNIGDDRIVLHNALFADVCGQYPEHFDSVVYVNVLEHVERDAEELRHIIKSLRAGGHVCIFVPALPWLYSDFDASVGHYRRYDKLQLEAMVRAAGFEILKSSYFDIIGIIPWFIVFKLLRRKLGGGDARIYDKLVVPFARLMESMFRVPIGKNIIMIARRVA